MKKNRCIGLILLSVLLLCTFGVSDTFADDATSDDFGRLGSLGGSFGTGLARLGYLIAGLGLIAFTVAAIFNKVSWKTLAYIMLSTFILTAVLGGLGNTIFSYLGAGDDFGASYVGLKYNAKGNGSSGGNAQTVPANKNS